MINTVWYYQKDAVLNPGHYFGRTCKYRMTSNQKILCSEGTKPRNHTPSLLGVWFEISQSGDADFNSPWAYLCSYLSSSWPMLPLQVKAQPSALHFPLHSLGPPPLPLSALFRWVLFFPVPPGPGAFSFSAANRYHLPTPCCPNCQKRRDTRSSATNLKSGAVCPSAAKRVSGLAGVGRSRPISKQRAQTS